MDEQAAEKLNREGGHKNDAFFVSATCDAFRLAGGIILAKKKLIFVLK